MIPKNIERRIRQHIQAKEHKFFAIVQPGFEQTALREISDECSQISNAKITEGGIEFESGLKDIWNLNFTSGCLTRILMRIDRFKAIYFEKFRDRIASIPWELYLLPGRMPAFSIKCRHSRLYHTGRLEEECITAIRERMKSVYPESIENQTDANLQTVFVRFEDDICSVSIDTTGEPLYRRGFRTHIADAPMRETIASCILREADVKNCGALLDPMCGSGVIALEGALISRGIPPGTRRRFAFEEWPGHRVKTFDYIKKTSAEKHKTALPGFKVYASDIDEEAVEITRHNFENTGIADNACISHADFFSLTRKDFPEEHLLIAVNPPYGGRIGLDDVTKFYKQIGQKLRNDFPGSLCALVVPGIKAEKAPGISPEKKILFMNGGIKVALIIGRV